MINPSDGLSQSLIGAASAALNPPATPLITIDPYTSWHETTNGRNIGFQARSVVGGYSIKMLTP